MEKGKLIFKESDKSVWIKSENSNFRFMQVYGNTPQELKENCEHIVNCWNSHNDLLEALQYYKNGIDHFYKCINFGKSFLDAEAIEFMNDSNIKIDNAIKKATQ